jgi:hypothetical protein
MTQAKANLNDEVQARKAVDMLIDASFTPDAIHVHAHDPSVKHELPIRHKTRIPFFATVGTVIGLVAGVVLGVLVSSGVVPSLGDPLNVEGSALPIITGVVLGAGMGAIWGALAGLAFWRKELHVPEAAKNDSIEIAVQAGDQRAEEARRILREAGATNVR